MHETQQVVHTQINSQIQNAFATLHCVDGGTSNTTAWGQQQCVRTRAARKFTKINTNIQNICNVGPGIQLTVLRGVSVAGAALGHWWDLSSLLPLSCWKAWSDPSLCTMLSKSHGFLLILSCLRSVYDNAYQITWICGFFSLIII